MRKNIRLVIAAFEAGKAKGKVGDSCSTDGTAIYSYHMKIAEKRCDGWVWVHPRNSTRTTNAMIDGCLSHFRKITPQCGHTDCATIPGMPEQCATRAA